jgi:hypothetical protein
MTFWGVADAETGKATLAHFGGIWRLVYSSGFSSGSLGGRRPGPRLVGAPFKLGPVRTPSGA